MPLGSETPRYETYYLKPQSKKEENGPLDPHFSVKHQSAKGEMSDYPDETKVSGYLMGLMHKEVEWPKGSGKMSKYVIILLVDGDRVFKIDMGINSNMARGVMNRILSTSEIDTLELRMYKTKPKEGQLLEFVDMYVSNNNNKFEWKFDYKTQIEPLIKIVPDYDANAKPGATKKIFNDVNILLWNAWIKHEVEVQKYAKSKGYFPSTKAPVTPKPPTEAPSLQDEFNHQSPETKQAVDEFQPPADNSDDLPF